MNEGAKGWMDGGILLIFVLIKYIIISLDGEGLKKMGGGFVLSYYYYYYYLPFLNSLRLGSSRVSRLKWQMHRPHVQQTLSVSKFGRRRRGLGGGGCALQFIRIIITHHTISKI
jgi:hypothetical protein